MGEIMAWAIGAIGMWCSLFAFVKAVADAEEKKKREGELAWIRER